MKKSLALLISTMILLSYMFIPCSADEQEEFFAVDIPIISGGLGINSSIIEGITTKAKADEKIVYVKLKEFTERFEIETEETDIGVTLFRNTVSLEWNNTDKKAVLSLGYTKNDIFKQADVNVPFITFNGEYYISLMHGMNVFGIDSRIIGREELKKIFTFDECISKDEAEKKIKYLEEKKIVDFNSHSKYLCISESKPYDKFYIEYYNNKSAYEFSFNYLPYYLNDSTASVASFPSYFINNFDTITDYMVGEYEADERYYDILCEIISNNIYEKNNFKIIPELYNMFQCLDDLDVINFISDKISGSEIGGTVVSESINAAADVTKIGNRFTELASYAEFEKQVLSETFLSSQKFSNEMVDDRILTALLDAKQTELKFTGLGYIIKNYESALFRNQYALYCSSEKLRNNIENPLSDMLQEDFDAILYRICTAAGDMALSAVSDGATDAAKQLIKMYRQIPEVKEVLNASEKLGKVNDCNFIQESLKNLDTPNIFDDSEKNYYNTRLLLQTSLTAHEMLLDSNLLAKIMSTDDVDQVVNRCMNISSLLTSIINCDVHFYSTEGISDDYKNIIDRMQLQTMPIIVVEGIEENSNYSWVIEPSIEADDIIVSDDSYDKYPLWNSEQTERPSDVYSVIQRDGKYALIDYDGHLYNDKFYNTFAISDYGEIIVSSSTPENIDSGNDILVSYDSAGKCKIEKKYIGGRGSAGWDSFYYDNNDKSVHVDGPGDGSNYGPFTTSVNIPILGKKVTRAVLLNVKGEEKLYGCYYNGNFSVEPQYTKGKMSFYNDMIALFNGDKWGYFNGKTGEQIIDFSCNGVVRMFHYMKTDLPPYMFTEGLLAFYSDEGCKFVDVNGNDIIPIGEFEEVRPVHKGLAWVKQNGKWGVIKLNQNLNTDTSIVEQTYTASQLANKTIPEIIDIMDGKYEIAYEFNYYTSGAAYFYNDEILPGLAFYITGEQFSMPYHDVSDNKFEKQEEQKIKDNLQNGKYQLDLIRVKSPGKINDKLTISNDMDYEDVSKIYGEFDCGFGPNIGYLSHKISDNAVMYFELPPEIYTHYNDGKYNNSVSDTPVTAKEVSSYNPKVEFAIITAIITKVETINLDNELIVATKELTDSDIKPEWKNVTSLSVKYPIFKTSDEALKKFLDENVTQKILGYMMTDSDYQLRIYGDYEYDMSLNGYLSIDGIMSNKPYMGNGAATGKYSFFVDLKNKKILTLKDIFSNPESEVYEEIALKTNKYGKTGDNATAFFNNALLDYDYSKAKFNLNKDTLTIIFDAYEVAAGVAGAIEIKIPVSDINLKSKINGVNTNTRKPNIDDSKYAERDSDNTSEIESMLAEYEENRNNIKILNAVNKYLSDHDDISPNWFKSSHPCCYEKDMSTGVDYWKCYISLDYEQPSENEIIGAYPHYAIVDKTTMICKIVANHEKVAEFDLSDYM